MAYALPTVAAVSNGGSNPTAKIPFNVVLTVTSTGTVGIKIRRVVCSQISGPGVTIGNPDLNSGSSSEDSGGASADRTLPTGLSHAGTNQPSTSGYRANAGSSAATALTVPCVGLRAGAVVLKFIVIVTRDDDDTEVMVICADESITVE